MWVQIRQRKRGLVGWLKDIVLYSRTGIEGFYFEHHKSKLNAIELKFT